MTTDVTRSGARVRRLPAARPDQVDLMSRTPECVTPAAGKLEDQRLGTMEVPAGAVRQRRHHREQALPKRKLGVEYDLQMDVYLARTPQCQTAAAQSTTPGQGTIRATASVASRPSGIHSPCRPTSSEWKHFVLRGCHKCWHWNWRTWKHIREHCPEAVRCALRALYKVSARAGVRVHTLRRGCGCRPPYPIQQLDPLMVTLSAPHLSCSLPHPPLTPSRGPFPSSGRHRVHRMAHTSRSTPLIGPVPVDRRFLPIDMKEGKCTGRCDFLPSAGLRRRC